MVRSHLLWLACSLLGLLMSPGNAQDKSAKVVSPEVNPDNSVTFRLLAPNAREVKVDIEGGAPTAMTKDDQGVWSFTTQPLAPDYYGYVFSVDGLSVVDPENPFQKPNLLEKSSVVHIAGGLPWDIAEVPHGLVHHHFYRSQVVGDQRDFYVYTPPDYDARASRKYPVLYLLHGFSDGAEGWTEVGHANIILDNLIAAGKVKPMLIVMPLGYGTPEILKSGFGSLEHEKLRAPNYERFAKALLTEVIPQVEKTYNVAKDRESRGIAGLSMGGTESLLTGLNHLDQFAWVGAFSSGGLSPEFDSHFPALDTKANQNLRLLWVACGTDDSLIKINRQLRDWLKTKDIKHVDIETPGAHTWMVWRRDLVEFSSLLFR